MRLFRRALALTTAVAAPVALFAVPAAPAGAKPGGPNAAGAVYVSTNQVGGNAVLAYDRFADGSLSTPTSYATGGTGTGGGLGSQGAVTLDESGRLLLVVNAGSDSVTSFRVGHDGLEPADTVASGGSRPVSVTIRGKYVYVLNAGGSGNISGFTVDGKGDLDPIAGSARPLSGSSTAPAQVQFSPDGRSLLVTEKATNLLDVYAVGRDGVASGPVVVPSSGATPFGFDFDKKGHAIVSEAFGGAPDASAVSSYDVTASGATVVSASVPTTETAACWIVVTGNGRFAYAGNAAGSPASVTGYRIDHDGALTILDADGKTGTASGGVTDLALSRDSRFLFGRIADGTVAVWAVAADGALSPLPSGTGLPAGAAGIAAQ